MNKETEPEKISRRDMLKKLGVGAVVGGAAAAGVAEWAEEELKVGKEGLETDHGIFVPLYESHPTGISPENIPPDTQALFLELTTKNFFKLSPFCLLSSKTLFGNDYFPEEIISYVTKNRIKIIFGNVDLPFIDFASSVGLLYGEFTMAKSFLKKTPQRTPLITRRELFKQTTKLAFSLWALSPLGIGALAAPANIIDPRQTPIKRTLSRALGKAYNLHPEVLFVFFNNLIVANKLLLVAEDLKEKTEKKPKIAFRFGAAHSGIEDFLRAGPDFFRKMIMAFPKWYLNRIINFGGGVDYLCSARIMELPPNTVEYVRAIKERNDQNAAKKLDQETIEERVTDKILKNEIYLEVPP